MDVCDVVKLDHFWKVMEFGQGLTCPRGGVVGVYAKADYRWVFPEWKSPKHPVHMSCDEFLKSLVKILLNYLYEAKEKK